MRAPALRLRHAGREPFKGEDEELTFPARLPPRADSHRSQNFALQAQFLDLGNLPLALDALPLEAQFCRVRTSS